MRADRPGGSGYNRGIPDDMRLVIAGGLALVLFLLVFALGQVGEIFRALGH